MTTAITTAQLPTYDQFIEPLLRFLVDQPEGAPARLAHEAAADALKLDAVARQQLLSSGAQLVYKNRAGWAYDRLKRAGLSDSLRISVLSPSSLGSLIKSLLNVEYIIARAVCLAV